jgi:hypothetical protein
LDVTSINASETYQEHACFNVDFDGVVQPEIELCTTRHNCSDLMANKVIRPLTTAANDADAADIASNCSKSSEMYLIGNPDRRVRSEAGVRRCRRSVMT